MQAVLRRLVFFMIVSSIMFGGLEAAELAASRKTIEFNRDVRPVFSNICYGCHGPDIRQRKAGLRLDMEAGAKATLDSGTTAIVPGESHESEHLDLPRDLPLQCADVDQGGAALVKDLKQRGLLDETLVIWGGEFGRTIYCQGELTKTNYGRDHHPRCFTIWMAGGGIKPGIVYGETDEFSYNITEKPIHIHDLNATILHCLGIDHTKLTFKFQGRHYRLTDVHGNVVKEILS